MVRKEAYQTILRIFKDKEFSDTLLHQRAKRLKSDRANVALFYNMVKGVVKLRGKLDYILSQHADEAKFAATDIKIKIWLYLGRDEASFRLTDVISRRIWISCRKSRAETRFLLPAL